MKAHFTTARKEEPFADHYAGLRREIPHGVGGLERRPSVVGSGSRRARAALVIVTTFVSLTLAEVVLRVATYGSLRPPIAHRTLRIPHTTRGWALEPNARTLSKTEDYIVEVRTNSRGLRDREHDVRPQPGVRRIVVLGDSFMEAYQVDEDRALPRLLEKAFDDSRVEVINLGVGGYGTLQELLFWEEEGRRYNPEVVILAVFLGNDLTDNSRALQERLRTRPGDVFHVIGRPFAHFVDDSSTYKIEPPDIDRITARYEARRRTFLRDRTRRPLGLSLIWDRLQRVVEGTPIRQPPLDPNIWLGYIADIFEPRLSSTPVTREQLHK